MLACGDNDEGQLGINEPSIIKTHELKRVNKDMIIDEIAMIRGQDKTLAFLTKA